MTSGENFWKSGPGVSLNESHSVVFWNQGTYNEHLIILLLVTYFVYSYNDKVSCVESISFPKNKMIRIDSSHLANHVNSASYQRVFQSKSPRVLRELYVNEPLNFGSACKPLLDHSVYGNERQTKTKINGHYKHEKTRGGLVVNFTWIPQVICLVGCASCPPKHSYIFVMFPSNWPLHSQ